jgi:membrane peptidoglycan carboxypeptidase
LLLGGIAAFVVIYVKTPIPDPNAELNANKTTLYYRDGASVLGGFAVQNRVSVPLDQVPRHVQNAVLAAENRTFWTDSGISLTGIIRAAWNQLLGGSKQSGSTITQQYVKNYYLTQEQTWSRKIKELFITLKIQRQLSKQEILQHYLNTSYFGRGAYGIEVAANVYFGTHVQDLTPHQAAVLASLLRAPSNYDPAAKEGNLERLEARYRYVLRGMADMGVIPTSEAQAPLPKIQPVADKRIYEGPRGHLLVQVRKELRKIGFTDQQIETGGLQVTTTFDSKAQEALEEAVRKNFPKENAKGVYVGVAAVRPGTGEVVAMYGGRDYLKRQFNDATQAKLQPGSTFKPFALAAALEHGVSLESRFAGNSPFKLPDGDKVSNEFNRDYGKYVDLIKATRDSINTAYVDMTINAISPNDVVDAAVRAGLPPDTPGLERHAKVSLGFASVSPVDMANAYATFAVGGRRATWHVVAEVRDRSGAVVYRNPEETTVEFDSKIIRDVNYALQEVVRRGSGEREAKKVRRPAAGKTGTHEDETAWFVGYTPQLSAAVAFYKDANGDGVKESLDDVGGMDTFFGGGYPARIWAAFMRRALAGEPVQRFSPPAHVGEPMNASPTPTPTVDGGPGPTASPNSPAPQPTAPSPTGRPTPPPAPPPPPPPDPDPEPEPQPTDTPRREPPPPRPRPPTPTPTPTKKWPIPMAVPQAPMTATHHDVE